MKRGVAKLRWAVGGGTVHALCFVLMNLKERVRVCTAKNLLVSNIFIFKFIANFKEL